MREDLLNNWYYQVVMWGMDYSIIFILLAVLLGIASFVLIKYWLKLSYTDSITGCFIVVALIFAFYTIVLTINTAIIDANTESILQHTKELLRR